MRRRDMLGFTGGAIAGSFFSPMECTRRFVDAALEMPTSELDVEEWESVVEEYSHLVGKVSVTDILPQLLADFDELGARIEMVPQELVERLVRTAGLLGSLIAISFLCVGRRWEANRYWRTAQRVADSIGDRQLGSLVRGRRAVYGLYLEANSDATLSLADRALDLAGDRPSAGRTSARAAQAQMFAKNGATTAAQEALHQLERDFEQLPESVLTDPSQWGWTEQRLKFVQSFVYSYAGKVSDAVAAQDSALSLYPSHSYRGPAQIQFHRAIAIAGDGDQTEGARHVLKTIEAVPSSLRTDHMIYRPATLALETMTDSTVRVSAMNGVRELMAPGAGRQ